MGAISPGPAAYLVKSETTRRSISIPRDRRRVGAESSEKRYGAKQANLGPGQYNLESIFENKRFKGQSFPKDIDKRSPSYIEPHLRQKHSNPGPGTYAQSIIDDLKARLSK